MSDCVASALLQSWNLSENLHFELGALALGDLPASVLDEVLRIDDQTQPIDPYWSGLRLADIGEWTPQWRAWIEMFGGLPEAAQGSNAWVVGGERSVNGLPILANDPHLMQGVPSLWYAVDLAGGDEVHVAGVTFPGAPVVVIGHNERLAWGLTNVMADYIDLALVERSA